VGYIYLTVAIIAEVIATTALKSSEEFSNLLPSVIVVLGYGVAFYALSVCLKTMNIGVVYAFWSGLGIVLISLMGWFVYKQALDLPAILGLALIIAGVVTIQLFSKTVAS